MRSLSSRQLTLNPVHALLADRKLGFAGLAGMKHVFQVAPSEVGTSTQRPRRRATINNQGPLNSSVRARGVVHMHIPVLDHHDWLTKRRDVFERIAAHSDDVSDVTGGNPAQPIGHIQDFSR